MLHDVLIGKSKHQTATPRRAAGQTLRDMTAHTVNQSYRVFQPHSPEVALATQMNKLFSKRCQKFSLFATTCVDFFSVFLFFFQYDYAYYVYSSNVVDEYR